MKRLFFAVVLAASATAHAGELHLTAGLEGTGTTWESDRASYGSLRVAYRWHRWSAYFLGKSGYAEVDERLLQYLGAGGELWGAWGRTRPYLRLGLNHQHENPRAAVENDPAGVLLGYGDGIRHRGGAGAGAGLQVPFATRDWGDWFAAAEVSADWMIGAPGPHWYWSAGVALGFRYELGSKR